MNFEGFGQVDGLVEPAEDALWVRNSDVVSWDLCAARHGYLRKGAAKQVPSEAMSFGTMMHTFAEMRLMGWDGVVTVQQLEEWWEEAVEKDGFSLSELAERPRIDASLQEAVQACAAWDVQVRPLLGYSEKVEFEPRLQAPLGVLPNGREVWAHGTPDVLDVDLIDDWKTAARGWKESKARATGQLSMYIFLAEAARGYSITDGTYWVWDRSKYGWKAHFTTRDAAHVDAYLRHVWQIARAIDADAYSFNPWSSNFGDYKRGWWCSAKYCAAWDVCEGKAINDDVWEEQPIDITAGWT